ncbi:MAG: hypothetical protein ACREMX_03960, partial [Gemmatimonadales bacterium]
RSAARRGASRWRPATTRARSARCSAPSSSPRIGPVISSSEPAVRRENRRARNGGDVTEAMWKASDGDVV